MRILQDTPQIENTKISVGMNQHFSVFSLSISKNTPSIVYLFVALNTD